MSEAAYLCQVWVGQCPEGADPPSLTHIATFKDQDTAQALAEQKYVLSQTGQGDSNYVHVDEIAYEDGEKVCTREVYGRSAQFHVSWHPTKESECCTSFIKAIGYVRNCGVKGEGIARISADIVDCGRKVHENELVAIFDRYTGNLTFTPAGLDIYLRRGC